MDTSLYLKEKYVPDIDEINQRGDVRISRYKSSIIRVRNDNILYFKQIHDEALLYIPNRKVSFKDGYIVGSRFANTSTHNKGHLFYLKDDITRKVLKATL